jgi:hypothetical protein
MKMAVTPLNATHRLRINYTSDLDHVIDVLLNASGSGGTWYANKHGGGTYLLSSAAMDVANIYAPIMGTDAMFTDFILQEYVGGAYNPVFAGSLGVAGSFAGHTSTPASQWTFTYSDNAAIKVRQRIMGAPMGQPNKYAYGSLPTPYKNIVDSYITDTGTNIGTWWSGRSAFIVPAFRLLVGSFNRKSRRRLGLV